MALKIIADQCTGCGSCASVCSAGAISTDLESFSMVIDPNLCTECHDCQASCPTGCIEASR